MFVEVKRVDEVHVCHVEDCKIVYGGMGHTVIMAEKTQKNVIGRFVYNFL